MRNIKILALMIVILLVSLVFVLDVKIVNSKRPITGGVMSDDIVIMERYKKTLSAEGIPFTLEKLKDGQVKIIWDAKYSNKVKSLESDILGVGSPEMLGLCFSSVDERDGLVSKLRNASYKHVIRDQEDGQKCVDWPKEIDLKVQEIYPLISEIRSAEKRRQLGVD